MLNDPEKKLKRQEQLKQNKITRDMNKSKRPVGRPTKY